MCRDKGLKTTKLEFLPRFGLEEDSFYHAEYNQLSGTTGLPVITYDGVQAQSIF